MLVTALGLAAAAVAIGWRYDGLGLAALVSTVLLLVSGAAFASAPGSLFSRMTLAACNMSFVALHIQLGRGTLEFHFGVFVLLALLLVYRDWRPIVFAAALVAVHHIAFDRMQAAGMPVYCTPAADFFKIVLHAVYVIVQTGVEVFIALMLQRGAEQGHELGRVVDELIRDDRIRLDVSHVPTASAAASRSSRSCCAVVASEVRSLTQRAGAAAKRSRR